VLSERSMQLVLRALLVVLAIGVASVFVPAARAQYFGQNIVRYETLDFRILKTEHFDIYYYDKEREATEHAARMAERWYTRLSEILQHQLPPNQPVILYASAPAFRGTTVIPGGISEGVGGVTEGFRRRIVMPFSGPMADFDHVLGHELVHAFQYDISQRRGPNAQAVGGLERLPLWFVEGMAEYLSVGPVDPHTAMWLRDAVRREQIPLIRQLNDPRFFPYRFGQAFWSYVAGRWGDGVVGRMLRVGVGSGHEAAIKSVLGMSPEELSAEWREALIAAYEPVLQASRPVNEQARELITEQRGGSELQVSPVLSPDGRQLMLLSQRDLFSIDLYLANAETGRIERKITDLAVDPHLDSIQFIGAAGSWSADGTRFAFPAIAGAHPQLVIYNVPNRRIERRVTVREADEIFNSSWSPDGRQIVFSGMANAFSHLFIVDLDSGNVRQITNDLFAYIQPSWSPDGRLIAFATDRYTSDAQNLNFGDMRLAVMDPQTATMRPVEAFRNGKHINPQWSPDSRSLYFVSDRDGISNIYRVSTGGGEVQQLTNLQTGVTGISATSPAFSVAQQANRLAMSVFAGGNYGIYTLETAEQLAGQPLVRTIEPLAAAVLPPRQRVSTTVLAAVTNPTIGLPPPDTEFPRANYQARLGLDYIAPPNISVGMSNFGSMVGGGTALYFSDMLGYHNLMTAFQTASTADTAFFNNLSAIAAYQNQKRRWTWGFVGGQVPFLTGGYGSGITTINGQPAVVEESTQFWQIEREFNGLLAYPFNRAQRFEFTGGYRNTSFIGRTQRFVYSPTTGQVLADERIDIPTPDSIHLGTAAAALVYDTSIFTGTSPMMGQRYRFEFGAAGGGLTYTTALADYRRYFRIARPLTFAVRALHYGRYGGGAEDPRLQNMFLGYQALVRGYEPNSFSPQECGPATEQFVGCPVFDRMMGSRIGVANAELRMPLLGFLGVIPSRSLPPVELAGFYDAGIAWGRVDRPRVLGGDRASVKSYGATMRINLLGFAIGQISYVRPLDRPMKDWMWQFAFLPGF
jgi:Tol biopolymer transport system component